MKKIFSILLLTGCCVSFAAELPDVVAKFGNTELKKSRFQYRQLPADPAERNKTLKKWVDTEVCLLIVRALLARSGIAPAAPAAQRYTALRKSQLGESKNNAFITSLEKQISHPDFCLKVISPKDKKVLKYQTADVTERFFMEARAKDLKEVDENETP